MKSHHFLYAATGFLLLMQSPAGAAAPANPLAGTDWQLHAIQSMDDAQGTTKIADPGRFTVHFGTDGRAAFQLDCNRGMGDWKVAPAGAMGPAELRPDRRDAGTVPVAHVDERIARDMTMCAYLLKDGKLFMSLMADGGIYEWHPAPVAAKPEAAAPAAQDRERTIKPVRFSSGQDLDRHQGTHHRLTTTSITSCAPPPGRR